MAGQEQVRPRGRGGDGDEGPEGDAGQVSARKETIDADVDDWSRRL